MNKLRGELTILVWIRLLICFQWSHLRILSFCFELYTLASTSSLPVRSNNSIKLIITKQETFNELNFLYKWFFMQLESKSKQKQTQIIKESRFGWSFWPHFSSKSRCVKSSDLISALKRKILNTLIRLNCCSLIEPFPI